jgi:hypothetical protein
MRLLHYIMLSVIRYLLFVSYLLFAIMFIFYFYFYFIWHLNYIHFLVLIIKLIDEQSKTTHCTSVSKHALKGRPLEQNVST